MRARWLRVLKKKWPALGHSIRMPGRLVGFSVAQSGLLGSVSDGLVELRVSRCGVWGSFNACNIKESYGVLRTNAR